MNLPRLSVCWCLAVAAVAGLVGCATTTYIPISVMHPAEINMSPYRQIVIGEIRGNMAQGFSDGAKEALVQSGQFKVVDRTQLRQILGEQSLSQSDLTNPKNRLRVGKLLTASALITGHTEGDFKDEVTYSDATCQRNLGRGPDGKTVWQAYACKIYTRSGKSTSSGSIDVVDIATGEIVKSKRLRGSCSSQTQATDATPAGIDAGELLGCAQGQNIAAFVKSISPWSETVMAPFAKDSAIPELETGIRHAQMGEFSEAGKVFSGAANSAEANPKIKPASIAKAYGNLGLVYEYTNKYALAVQAFKKAYLLSPDQRYIAEQAAVTRREAEMEELKRQGAVK